MTAPRHAPNNEEIIVPPSQKQGKEQLALEITGAIIEELASGPHKLFQRSLGILGRYFEAERTYVLRLSEDKTTLETLAEWHATTLPPFFTLLPAFPSSALGAVKQKLLTGEIFCGTLVMPVSPAAAETRALRLATSSSLSFLIPLVHRHETIGLLGITATGENDFPPQSTFLRSLADLFANSIRYFSRQTKKVTDNPLARLLWQNTPDYIFLLDANGTVVDANARARQTMASENGAPNGSLLDHFFDKSFVIKEKITNALANGFEEFETIMHLPTGDIPVEVHLRKMETLPDAVSPHYIFAIIREISRRRIKEQHQLRLQRFEAAATLTTKISHAYNNILTGIVGAISTGSDGDSAEAQDLIRKNSTISLIRSQQLNLRLLAFCQNQALKKQAVCLNTVLRKSIAEVTQPAGIELNIEMMEPLPEIYGDAVRLREAIANLLLNALEAMPSGGTISIQTYNSVRPENKHLAQSPPTYIMIVIKDTGVGISGEIIHKIFDPYFTTKKQHQGLGLAICCAVALQHGGHLDVSSTPGNGSTFTLRLPLTNGAMTEKKQQMQPARPPGKGRILFMDDEEPVRKVGVAMLTSLGYEVDCAVDGHEVLRLYQDAQQAGKPYDLVIMDLTVPDGYGGEDAIQELRRLDPSVRAIVSSGYAGNPIMADYQQYGFCAMLKKPYGIKYLNQVLTEALTGQKNS